MLSLKIIYRNFFIDLKGDDKKIANRLYIVHFVQKQETEFVKIVSCVVAESVLQ